jgi:hypothetical protein
MPPPHLSLTFPPTCHCHSGPILRSPHVARPHPSHRRATPFSSSSALRYTPTPAQRPPCSATPPSSSRRGCPRPPPHPLRRPNLRSRCLHFPSTPLFPLHHQPRTVTAAPTIPLPPSLSPHAPPTEKKIAAAAMQRLSLGSPAGKNSRLSVAADEEAEATDEKAAKAMVRARALNRSIHLVPVLTLLCFLVLFLLSHDPSAALTGMSSAPRRPPTHSNASLSALANRAHGDCSVARADSPVLAAATTVTVTARPLEAAVIAGGGAFPSLRISISDETTTQASESFGALQCQRLTRCSLAVWLFALQRTRRSRPAACTGG